MAAPASARCSDEEPASRSSIIGNLDDDGYLQLDGRGDRAPGRRARRRGGRRALARVQMFDPTGVAARDLTRVSARSGAARSASTTRSCCASSTEHLDPLIEARLPRRRARSSAISVEAVAAAAARGRRSSSRARAAPFGGEDPIYIVPDIYVHKIGDEFHVVLNDDGLPRLRINAPLPRGARARQRDGGEGARKTYVHEIASARRCG